MAVSISERLAGNGDNEEEFYRLMLDSFSSHMRVSIPGIIQSFDPVTQTVTVQPAIRERVRGADLSQNWVSLPLLLDVPVVMPRAGGFVLTLPIQTGDECMVIFSDMCIDAWFTSSGVQNQMEKRRLDLSDGICIPGLWSQPNKLSNYSTSAAQLRSVDGSTYISLTNGEIDLVASVIKKNGVPI